MKPYDDRILEIEAQLFDIPGWHAPLREAILDLLHELDEERQSLWQMLDEMKASEMEQHTELVKSEIDSQVERVKTLLQTAVGEA
jgi:hypothetical protein